jgi:ubiquinone/menaquinone biosynthesis C-methylase UbiE
MDTPEFFDRNYCILCFSESLRPIWELTKFPFTDSLDSYLRDYPTIDQVLLFCNVCGMVQLQRVVSPKFLYDSSNYSYERVYSSKIQREGDFYKKLLFEILPDVVSRPRKVLEIGGGSDLFINTLIDIFEFAQIIDPAPVISQKLNPKVEITKGFMEDNWPLLENQKFDLVICRHVIEHVSNPHEFLSEILKRITKETFVILETPNFNSLLAKGRLDAIFHQHLSYFQPKTFRNLVERSGGLVVKEVLLENGSNGGVMIFVIQKSLQKNRERSLQINEMSQNTTRVLEQFSESLLKFKSNIDAISAKIDNLKNGFYGLGAGSLVPTLNYHLGGRLSKSYGIIDDDVRKHGKSYKNVEVEIVSPSRLTEVFSNTCLITSLENRKVLVARAKEMGFTEVLCPPPLD